MDDTDRIEDKYWTPGPRYRPPWDTKYITYGFAYLQDMLEHAMIDLITGDEDQVRYRHYSVNEMCVVFVSILLKYYSSIGSVLL